jgi:hypothetical protein
LATELKSYSEMALMYQTAIESIVTGGLSSYSIAGRSFSKNDLSTLERLFQYYKSKAAEQDRGFVTFADMRARGGVCAGG